MNRLDRYIAVTVILGALSGLLVIIALSFVFEFIDEADDIGRGSYDLATAMLVVALSMVQRAYEAFPMATLVGALVSLGALAARSELTVMRAVGVSVAQIARAVVIAGVLLALLAAVIGEWLAPNASRMAQALQAEAFGGPVGVVGDSFWARDGDYRLRAEQVLSPELLADVRAYEVTGDRLIRIISAPQAQFDGNRWQLESATITRFHDTRVEVTRESVIAIGGELRPNTLEVVVVDAATLAGFELARYIGYLKANDMDAGPYSLALWVKLVTPLSTVVMLLLTVPLVFGSQRSGGVGQQIFLGVLIGLAFFLLNRFLGNAGLVYGLPAPVSALAPTLLFLGLALMGLRQVR